MIDPEHELLVTFAEAGRRAHLGVTPATITRWALYGRAGVKLESVKVGQRRKTSVEALRRFLTRLAEGKTGRPAWLITDRAELRRRAKALGLL